MTITQAKTNPTIISLSNNYLLCLRQFAARTDIRTYLNGFHFRTAGGRAYISATDGHMAAVIRTPEGSVTGPDINWCVPINLFEKVLKGFSTITFGETIQAANPESDAICEVTLTQDGAKLTVPTLAPGSRFPDVKRVIPITPSGNQAVQINLNLLSRIHKAFIAFHGKCKTFPVLGYPQEQGQTVLIDFGDPEFVGVVMPLRENPVVERPSWVGELSMA